MIKRQKTYIEENFIDVIYSLVNAYERGREVPDKDKIKILTPINGAYSGYLLNKVQFEDPRSGKIYNDEWKRTYVDDEEDRLKVIRKMNKRIQDYNKFVKEHKKELGIDRIGEQKYFQRSEYPEWSLTFSLSSPSLKKTDKVVSNRTINSYWFYQKAIKIPKKDFTLRFNKTIYNWILDMLPQSFNDSSTKFLSDKHILFRPKLEFENWFMANGIIINDAQSLFDVFINDTPSLFDVFQKEKEESGSKLEIYKNTDIAKTKKIRELRYKVTMVKDSYRVKVYKMIEEGTLDDFINKNCRKKNGKMNWAKLGNQIGCHADTARKIMKETGMTYLFDHSKNISLK